LVAFQFAGSVTVPTVAEAFAAALKYHQAGDLRLAETLYRQILQADPGHADSYHLLGVLAYQRGQYEEAIALIQNALTLHPSAAVYFKNLGVAQEALGQMPEALASFQNALRLQPQAAQGHCAVANTLRALGRLEEAAAHFGEAVRLRPGYPEAHHNLADTLFLLEKFDEAVVHYQQALLHKPHHPESHCNLANALYHLGKLPDAVEHSREALRLRPDYAEAHNNLANALLSQGKPDEALGHCREALRLRPHFAEAHNNLGNVMAELGKSAEAIGCFRAALHIRPGFAEACNNLGNALALEDHVEEAIRWCQEAVRLKPTFAQAYANLGQIRVQQSSFAEAQLCFDQALRLDPGRAHAHFNQALLWLLQGNWAKGWLEYEWRWQTKDFPQLTWRQPRWDGSPQLSQGQTLLVLAEQGLGDTIQFVRYLPQVQHRGVRVILQCQPPLVRLLSDVQGIDQVVAQGSPLPPVDAYVPLLSLPAIFGTMPESVPATVPYLRADPTLVEHWRLQLAPLRGFKVGIAWQGNPTYRGDRQRSISLAQFARLAGVKGVQLLSLQKGPGTDQLRDLAGRFPVIDLSCRLDETSEPFMDTAALMMNLDLVICSDTAVAHLAGALGVTVWVALPLVPDWRWLLQRPDSPWYPTMRLFRQRRQGNWDDVFELMAQALATEGQ
jgi:tetratricopeptide (TPR) repeat protein